MSQEKCRKSTAAKKMAAAQKDIDRWYEGLEALGAARYEPGEREQIQAMLAEADERARADVRRQMALSSASQRGPTAPS
jgi:hypothetical protein